MTTTEPRTLADTHDDAPTAVIDVVTEAEHLDPATAGRTSIPHVGRAAVGPRRQLRGLAAGDARNLMGSVVGGLSLAVLLFGAVAPLSGKLGFVLVAYFGFLGFYGVLTALDNPRKIVVDRVMTVALATAAALMFGTLVTVLGFVFWRGRKALPHLNFFTQDQSTTGPLDPLTSGGVLHALIGTLEMMTICLIITVPLGITCAVFLAVVKGPGSRFIRTVVEAMTALPSIVAGLFILATWILALGNDKSGLAAAFALSVMMLPIIIRAADVVLRLVPANLMEASEALGAPRWRSVWHVVLPTSRSGLATAVILGTARGVGETSPVLLTAGFTQFINGDPLHGSMISLPLAAFSFVRSPEPNVIARGFACASLLMILVLVLFITARLIGGRGPGQLSARQRRRRARQSAADARRFAERALGPTTSSVPAHVQPTPESS